MFTGLVSWVPKGLGEGTDTSVREEGWIKEEFVFHDEPVILEHGNYEITKDRVFARYSINGKIRKVLNKGRHVTVYLLGQEWSVTSQGFIMTEFLMWRDI